MLHVGYACDWSQPRHHTWSGTPLALLEALQRRLGDNIVDLDVHLPKAQRLSYTLFNLSRHPATRRWQSEAPQSPRRVRAVGRRLQSLVQRTITLDAVLSLSDFAVLDNLAQFLYFDLSVAAYRAMLSTPQLAALESVWYRDVYLHERERQQRRVYESAAGLFAMSRFAADGAQRAYGLDAEKLHVVGAGARVLPEEHVPRLYEREYMLFVGRDFERKAGPLVIEAYGRYRQQVLSAKRSPLDLVVAGASVEQVRAVGIEGVVAVGSQDLRQLQSYFAHATAFVMPSHFEAFGLVFAEALAHGLPVIARDCCAMPEIVRHGDNGLLMPAHSNDAGLLAEHMQSIVSNTKFRDRARGQRIEVAKHYSWDRVAADMVSIISNKLGGSTA